MQASKPSRLVLLLVGLACLLVPACTGADVQKDTSAIPDREELVGAIAGHAEVVDDFDQVRAIVVATDDRLVFEQYSGPIGTAIGMSNRSRRAWSRH